MQKLHVVPRFDDSLTYVYAEHSRVDRSGGSIGLWDQSGITELPVAAVRVLMLGPGSSITHEAVRVLADNNCLIIWCGEETVRFYAQGIGATRSSTRLIRQAALVSDPESRIQVARRMYAFRFKEVVLADLGMDQIRGLEGQRVRETYRRLSEQFDVPWHGRSYDRIKWQGGDPVNRAISAANSCLYGLCHAAIISAGYSPALGFIHTGKQLSFVYDIADLYKTECSLPTAFAIAAQDPPHLEREVRIAMRDSFRASRLIQRVIPDIKALLAEDITEEELAIYDDDPALPAPLWSPSEAPEEGSTGGPALEGADG
ncbi:MAG: type I-E CRISPR-associated endonuclease Cas1 [candidate division WS1 bacterium]|nr:type I-E CRISPR-associated endonuclease Cas1 [candidate division WS1 bacterium]